jgi:formate--tetrahydrofolate ligase
MHGGVAKDALAAENVEAVTLGCANLSRHLRNIERFGVPAVVAINRFTLDTPAEIDVIRQHCAAMGVKVFECTHWADGGAGAEDLAHHVAKLAEEGSSDFNPLYPNDLPLWEKIERIALKLYGASEIIADQKVRDQIKALQEEHGHFPVCMAKTQYSFSTDPNLRGAPSDHGVPIREVRLANGAEFIVVVCGDIMTMPGLPRKPAANSIRLDEEGQVEGLF